MSDEYQLLRALDVAKYIMNCKSEEQLRRIQSMCKDRIDEVKGCGGE